jgi:microcompartment protein CcmL/EutN
MVVLDAMEKRGNVRVLQTELNDAPGVCMKLQGAIADVEAAAQAAQETARDMQMPATVHVIEKPAEHSRAAYEAAPDFNPLIEQSSVKRPS